ncbi:zonular occludens toxin domain-containing protein, partial [Sphingomonas sp. NCPPB 2930]
MLHLITGGNGTGKTLNTIKWVRDLQLRENRPVAYNGRFDAVAGGELASWKVIDFADWQNEPDGTIFLIDECHNDLPKRAPSAAVPAHVRMLGEHRKRGFDFFLITQHPSNIDVFVRKLIASPGWHRHLKRSFGVDLVSVLEWAYVNEKCELPNSSKNGTVTMVPFPKEVYGWYTSASLHTGKKKIPKQLLVFLALLVIVPLLLYFGITRLVASTAKKDVDKPEVTGSKP